jgi:class 3 adenylate cyclase
VDEVFGAFDNFIAKYDMEKIKTIGDAYMCACGLLCPYRENAIKAVKAGMDISALLMS